jgi:hypothetical protein
VAALERRIARLQAARDALAAARAAARGPQLVLGRSEEFARRVRDGLEGLGWHDRREVIRALVRRIEIDHDQGEACSASRGRRCRATPQRSRVSLLEIPAMPIDAKGIDPCPRGRRPTGRRGAWTRSSTARVAPPCT